MTKSEVLDGSICAVCGDRSNGHHYGAVSCEGCKGFFKRSVRKSMEYVCRESGQCSLELRKRTRCQRCRFDRCLEMGMKREAVQEERRRGKPAPRMSIFNGKGCKLRSGTIISAKSKRGTASSLSSAPKRTTRASRKKRIKVKPAVIAAPTVLDGNLPDASDSESEMPMHIIPSGLDLPKLTLANLLTAELCYESPFFVTDHKPYLDIDVNEHVNPLIIICQSVEKRLPVLINWARQLPMFSEPYLTKEDQFWLLRSAWSELLVISAAFNSMGVRNGLLLTNGRHLGREKARQFGLGPLLDRFLTELVNGFRDLDLERVEIALLRAVILFNPDASNLVARNHVESVRESLYTGLHAYCASKRPTEMSRFTKLLLRLPSLRTIAQKCLEHLVFVKMAAEDSKSRRLINLVEYGVWPNHERFLYNYTPASRSSFNRTTNTNSQSSSSIEVSEHSSYTRLIELALLDLSGLTDGVDDNTPVIDTRLSTQSSIQRSQSSGSRISHSQ